MREIHLIALVCVSVVFAALAHSDEPGSIEGKIEPAGLVEHLVAVSEAGEEHPGQISLENGSFHISGLPEGKYYLILETKLGRIQGVDLTPLDVVEPAGEPLSETSLEWILDFVRKFPTYENKKRVLYIEGRANSACALVELLRDQPTTFDRPENRTWRVDRWYFVKEFGGWRRFSEKMLVRKMLTPQDFDKLSWIFEPSLGGIEISSDSPRVKINYRISEPLDPAKGKVPCERK